MVLDIIIGIGDGSFVMYSILGFLFFVVFYFFWGGLAVVVWIDVVQVVLLIIGGLVMIYLVLDQVMFEGGFFCGLVYIYEVVLEKFFMIVFKGEIIMFNGRDVWFDLFGLVVIIGGFWVANFYYWGFNQYIIQCMLVVKSLKELQWGIVFVVFFKLIILFIVVIFGIIVYVFNMGLDGVVMVVLLDLSFINLEGIVVNDNVVFWLISNFIFVGLKGLVLAVLAVVIVFFLVFMVNFIFIIFMMDIYKFYINLGVS